MHRRDFLRFAGLSASTLALPAAVSRAFAQSPADRWRTFEVTTRVEVLNPAGRTRVWLPTPLTVDTPYQKLDLVLIPAFQPGAMEHAGNIAYNAESLLLDESATQDQLLARANVIAHETAHMWFGNLVTMRWFDDVWTKEVFANFIADKVIVPQFPQVRHDLQFFLGHYGSAYDVDRSAGANPIRQPLDNLNDAGSLYGPIVYDKSPVVMRQLEALLGEEAFRDGVRSYLRRHAFGNATWDDLIAALAARTKLDLKECGDVVIVARAAVLPFAAQFQCSELLRDTKAGKVFGAPQQGLSGLGIARVLVGGGQF